MEQHAVPQDITGFKFKLVGDMTLKQFGELAFGAIVAYLFFASGLHPLIKWPFVIFFIFLGIALAFLPIQERPLDVWIINFFKAIYKPTYFTWKRNAGTDSSKPPEVTQGFVPLSTDPSTTPLMAAGNVEPKIQSVQTQSPSPTPLPQAQPEPKIPEPEQAPQPQMADLPVEPPPSPEVPPPQKNDEVISIEELLKQRQQQAPQSVSQPEQPMTIEDLMKQREQSHATIVEKSANELSAAETKLGDLTQKNTELMMKVDELRNQIYAINNSGGDASKLQPDLERLVAEKALVYEQVGRARDEMTTQRVAPIASPAYMEPVRDMSSPKPKPQPPQPIDLTNIALTSSPNVVNGLVLGPTGVPLEGVIITVKDSQGNSIRALRTSKLGQFIASTPLASGEYYMEFEKTGFGFDVWKIILDGSVLAPVRVSAREENGHS